MDDSDSVDGFDLPDAVTSVCTPKEMLTMGLELAGVSREIQKVISHSNICVKITLYHRRLYCVVGRKIGPGYCQGR